MSRWPKSRSLNRCEPPAPGTWKTANANGIFFRRFLARTGLNKGKLTIDRLPNFIDGNWHTSAAGQALSVLNPASAKVLAEVPLSPRDEVDKAAEGAARAFVEWRRTPSGERVQPLFKLKTLLEQNLDGLARIITDESGKTIAESIGELRRAIENVETACGIPTLMQGTNSEDIAAGIDEHMIRQPLGVVAAITPFNFPGMIPFWFLPYCMACAWRASESGRIEPTRAVILPASNKAVSVCRRAVVTSALTPSKITASPIHHRQRDLRDHQPAACPAIPRSTTRASSTFADRKHQIRLPHSEDRRHSEEQARREADSHGVKQYRQIQRDLLNTRHTGRPEGSDRTHSRDREHQPERSARPGQQQTFREKLPCQAADSRAQRRSDRHFPSARGGVGQQKIRDIRAGDQQQAHTEQQHH